MGPPVAVDDMPELEITDEQASYLDDLRDAIESEIVGPYGTVKRRDALQYLIDNFGEPETIYEAGDSTRTDREGDTESNDEREDVESGPRSTAEGDTDEAETDEESGDLSEETATVEKAEGDEVPAGPGSSGDAMLNEMMSLLDTHEDKWRKADSEETKYEVDLPDGDVETVQTKDDVRALLFKHHR
jgi:hypothetical protein